MWQQAWWAINLPAVSWLGSEGSRARHNMGNSHVHGHRLPPLFCWEHESMAAALRWTYRKGWIPRKNCHVELSVPFEICCNALLQVESQNWGQSYLIGAPLPLGTGSITLCCHDSIDSLVFQTSIKWLGGRRSVRIREWEQWQSQRVLSACREYFHDKCLFVWLCGLLLATMSWRAFKAFLGIIIFQE